jgi:hypothetical protein
MRRILACFCLLAMPACVPPQHDLNAFTQYNYKTAFNPADFLPFEGEGAAAIHGQAFLRTTIGEVRTCAGQDVTLLPGTVYNAEFFSAQDQGFRGARINRDAAADKYSRKGICDAQGNFAFNHLPVGNWIIAANVEWDVPGSYGGHQGGILRQPVDAKAGPNDLILTDRDLMR